MTTGDDLIVSHDGIRWTAVPRTAAGVGQWFDAQIHAGAGRLFVSSPQPGHESTNIAVVGTVVP